MITKEIVLGKVSIVGRRGYSAAERYDILDAVHKDGESYLSLHADNRGNDPSLDITEEHWMLLAKRGESWYEMCVRTGRFEGTEEEFLAQKDAQINAAVNATNKAEEAAAKANMAATGTENAIVEANKAAEKARSEADRANLSALNADSATARAGEATELANTAAGNAQSLSEHPGYVGSDFYFYVWDVNTKSYKKTDTLLRPGEFKIYKTYRSIAAMLADKNNVEQGKFVLVVSNVEDEDNGKLYVKGDSTFDFLVDMSGVRGFEGKTPQISIGTVSAGETPSAGLSEDGFDVSGNPKYKLNLVLPSGPRGEAGKSAYQLALEDGFKGTESEWLQSLRGKPFTYSDFTVEQIEELMKPGNDAATLANKAATFASEQAREAEKQGTYAKEQADRMTLMLPEYNVSIIHPTEGIDSTNKYTLEGAIGKIPEVNRKEGIKISFFAENGKLESYYWKGGTFTDTSTWTTSSTDPSLELKVATMETMVYQHDVELDELPIDNLGDATANSMDIMSMLKICGCQFVIVSDKVPDVAPDFIGQVFIDKKERKVYTAVDVNSAGDFKPLN